MNQLLCGHEIVKCFSAGGEKRNVLNGVSVEIQRGEFVSIMGPSGSGKSTLLYALSGMDNIDSGEIMFEDQRLTGLSEDALSDLRRNKMGFVFQQPTFLKNLNILDNIILPQARERQREGIKLADKARSLMKQVGIAELEQREITQVSGGQLQRAGICRALMSNPAILFGDEPTGALNSKAAQEVMELFTQINARGTAILLVTHDACVAARADRILFLHDGKIVGETKLGKYFKRDLAIRKDVLMRDMKKIGI